MRKSLIAVTRARVRRRRIDGVRDQGLRQEPGRPGQQQGRHAQQVARRDAGADAGRTKRRSAKSTRRPAPRRRGATRRSRRPRRPTARPSRPTEGGPATRARMAAAKADAVDKASKRIVYEVVLSEDSGQLQVRRDRAARRGEGQDRRTGRPAHGRSEGRLLRNRRPHGQRRRQDDSTRSIGMERAEAVKRVSLRAAPDSAAPDERDQLRRRQAGGRQQDAGRPRAEPPRRHPHPRVSEYRLTSLSPPSKRRRRPSYMRAVFSFTAASSPTFRTN